MEVLELRKKDEKEWDEFVKRQRDATFFHFIGWKNVIEKTYKHKSYYLIAKEDGEIKGILPLFLMKSVFFGKNLISIPFALYGGVCAEDRTTKELLISGAKEIVKNNNLGYIELRHQDSSKYGCDSKDTYYTFILKLNSNPAIIRKNFRKSLRRLLNKAEKNNRYGISVKTQSKNIKDFYEVDAHNMRDLGSPVHSYIFFRNLVDEFPSHINVSTAGYNGNTIAALFLLKFKNTVIILSGASLKEYQNLHTSQILHWETIKFCCEQGFEYLDFGRSIVNSSTFFFKEGWGAEPKQLNYLYYTYKADTMPSYDPSNPKYSAFTKVWNRLPVSITRIVGPKIRKHIP